MSMNLLLGIRYVKIEDEISLSTYTELVLVPEPYADGGRVGEGEEDKGVPPHGRPQRLGVLVRHEVSPTVI